MLMIGILTLLGLAQEVGQTSVYRLVHQIKRELEETKRAEICDEW